MKKPKPKTEATATDELLITAEDRRFMAQIGVTPAEMWACCQIALRTLVQRYQREGVPRKLSTRRKEFLETGLAVLHALPGASVTVEIDYEGDDPPWLAD